MALSATVRRFSIDVSDSDRGVYETLDLRAAQQPSESARYLVARVLARVLEHREGVEFSKGGTSSGDEPALLERNLQGDIIGWFEIGSPTVDRLHKASKTGARVALYGWKGLETLAGELVGAAYKAEQIEIYGFDYVFLDAIAELVDRKNEWSVAISGGSLYVEVGGKLFEGAVTRIPVG